MAKSKNHTNHNQGHKDHANGIKRIPRQRYGSMRLVQLPPALLLIFGSNFSQAGQPEIGQEHQEKQEVRSLRQEGRELRKKGRQTERAEAKNH